MSLSKLHACLQERNPKAKMFNNVFKNRYLWETPKLKFYAFKDEERREIHTFVEKAMLIIPIPKLPTIKVGIEGKRVIPFHSRVLPKHVQKKAC